MTMTTETRPARARFLLLGIVLAGFLLRLLVAGDVPAWQGPDEPRHLEHAAMAAHRLPQLLEERRYLDPFRDEDPGWQLAVLQSMDREQYWSFAPFGRFAPLRFEQVWGYVGVQLHRPPLYYLGGAAMLLAGGSSSIEAELALVRWWSVMLGTLLIPVAGAIGFFAGGRTWWGLVAAGVVAFLPMAVFISAVVNNDNLVNLLAGVYFVLAFRLLWRGWDWRWVLALGLVVVLGVTTKRGFVTVAATVPLVLWLALPGSGLPMLAQRLAGGAVAATYAVLAGLAAMTVLAPGLVPAPVVAYLFNEPDQAQRLLDADLAGPLGALLVRNFLDAMYQGFVGRFGWFVVPSPGWVLGTYLVVLLGGGWAALVVLARHWSRPAWASALVVSVAVAIVVAVAVLERLVYLEPGQVPQGRYLLVLLVPVAAVVAIGWTGLLRMLRVPEAITGTVLLLLLAAAGLGAWLGSIRPFFQG